MTRRTVVECAEDYRVEPDPGGFTTTDRTLAVQVARQLDRDDPLPCPGHQDFIELPILGRHPDDCDALCGRCGRAVSAQERREMEGAG